MLLCRIGRKRYSKRYLPKAPHHLLHVLALNQEKKRVAARALLEQYGLIEWGLAYQAFAGGHTHVHWLFDQLDAIMGREVSSPQRRGIWAPPSARGGGTAPKKNAPQAAAPKAASKSPAATKPRRSKGTAVDKVPLHGEPPAPTAASAIAPLVAFRTLREITESQTVVVRRNDSGLGIQVRGEPA